MQRDETAACPECGSTERRQKMYAVICDNCQIVLEDQTPIRFTATLMPTLNERENPDPKPVELQTLIMASGELLEQTPEEAEAMWDRVIENIKKRADEAEVVQVAGQEKAGRSWLTMCGCCGRNVPTPYHHHHRDTNRETDYCQECYDTGCDLLTCSLP